MTMPAIWFLILVVGGFCGMLSGVSNIREGKDGGVWFILGAVNFVFAGIELGKLL